MKKKILTSFLALIFIGCGGSSTTTTAINDGINQNFTDSFEYSKISNNPYYPNSWYIYPNNLTNEDINVTHAWQEGYTGQDIKVAIIDYGFDIEHEDLKSAIYQSINSDDNSFDLTFDSHGTMCSGIIGARNNTKGSIGVAPSSKIINIQSRLSTTSETIAALNKAKELNADIINNSWGSYNVDDAVRETIDDLAANGRDGKGMIILFATGNAGCNLDLYCEKHKIVPNDESELENVIGVGSTDQDNNLSDFSNYGNNIDLVAPGSNIYSTFRDQTYATADGTSYSTPIVAGVAALILDVNPNLTFLQVKEILENSATKVGEDNILYVLNKNLYFGYGKVNAGRAIELAKTY